jgi:hypothetical protein
MQQYMELGNELDKNYDTSLKGYYRPQQEAVVQAASAGRISAVLFSSFLFELRLPEWLNNPFFFPPMDLLNTTELQKGAMLFSVTYMVHDT